MEECQGIGYQLATAFTITRLVTSRTEHTPTLRIVRKPVNDATIVGFLFSSYFCFAYNHGLGLACVHVGYREGFIRSNEHIFTVEHGGVTAFF